MKSWLASLMFGLTKPLSAATYAVLVSFSMPELLLEQTLADAARLQVPVYIRGLHQNSLPKTLQKIHALSQKNADVGLQIDPNVFTRFDVHKVPAFVREEGSCFDVLYGNLKLKNAMEALQERGACLR